MRAAASDPIAVVYTDVVGSTALTESLGEDAAHDLLQRHNRVIRKCVRAHRGRELKALGDGFQLAFDDASDALACALAIQRTLAGAPLSVAGNELHIRIGVNAGKVIRTRGEVLGRTAIVAQRVMSQARAGEILLSRSAREVAEVPPGAWIESRGRFRLKGLAGSLELLELVWPRSERADRELPSEQSAAPPLAGTRPFFGREAELRLLEGALASAQSGVPRMALVIGEAGIGKTRMVEEFADAARGRGVEVARGRAYADLTLPLQPLREAIADLSADPGGAAAGTAVVELGRERASLVERLAGQIVRNVTRPTLLWLDDLHWADELSVDVLRALTRRMARRPSLPLLVIVAARASAKDADSPLASFLAEADRLGVLQRVELARLDEDSLRRLVRASAGGELAAPAREEWVLAQSEGNPFYAEQLASAFGQRDGPDSLSADPSGELPGGIRQLLESRLESLAPESRRALRLAALLVREFPRSRIESGLAVSRADAQRILSEAVRTGVLLERRAGDEVLYRFDHALTSACVADELTLAEREQFHAEIATALLRQGSSETSDGVAELAHHLTRAGAAVPAERVAEFAEKAGDQALGVFAFAAAARSYGAALAALARLPQPDRARRAELARRLAWVTGHLSQLDAAVQLADRAIEDFEAVDDRPRATLVRIEIGAVLVLHARAADAVRYLEQARRETAGDRALRAQALASHALVLDQLGEGAELREVARSLLALGVRLRSPELRERAMNAYRNWYGNHSSDLRRTRHWTQRMLESARQRGDRRTAVVRLAELAFGQLLAGEMSAALRSAETALRLARDLDLAVELLNASAVRLMVLCLRGDWEGFEAAWRVVSPLVGTTPGALRFGLLVWARRRADLWLGRLTPRVKSPGRVYAGMRSAEVAVAASSALLAAEQRDRRAHALIERAESGLGSPEAGLNRFIALQGVSAAWNAIGQPGRAARWYDALSDYAGTFYLASTDLELARMARALGDLPRARRDAQRAVRVFRREGLRPLLALGLSELAAIESATGPDARARGRDKHEEARSIADSLGIELDV